MNVNIVLRVFKDSFIALFSPLQISTHDLSWPYYSSKKMSFYNQTEQAFIIKYYFMA